jgi:NAD(P)H-dependent flavin oxidoreductase YrpB (nitropropane dioxygenase family)
MGADMAYIGSPFIATEEARASDAYKQMIVEAAADIVYSNYFTGVHGNYLKPSVKAAGMDPDTCQKPILRRWISSGHDRRQGLEGHLGQRPGHRRHQGLPPPPSSSIGWPWYMRRQDAAGAVTKAAASSCPSFFPVFKTAEPLEIASNAVSAPCKSGRTFGTHACRFSSGGRAHHSSDESSKRHHFPRQSIAKTESCESPWISRER